MKELAVALLLTLLLLAGCGRYGPPVRAQHTADPGVAGSPTPADTPDPDEDPDA